LLAATKAATLGAHAQAEMLAKRAVDATSELPPSDATRALRARALMVLGRVRLEGFAPTETFDLESALEPLERARRELGAGPPELRVEIAQLLAAAHCERGDMGSLERALAVLVDTSQALLAAGQGGLATRLFNDQAAVYLRMGDPVRAMALLEQSREVYERRGNDDAVAVRELAETDHLIARIPLHVRARPGREDDALSRALDHAVAARRAFVRLGDVFSAARVEETMGRLELARGRLERAVEHLRHALAEQDRLADLVGLARTSAALSSALLDAGRGDDALALLADAIDLNHQKGSSIGVAYNRRAFEALAARVAPGPEAARALAQVRRTREAAQRDLGALSLPGERDP
jgi:tetratricopeptide (TPR) repeat protein